MVSGLGVRCTDLGVIREKDIISCRNGKVTFRYLHAKSKRYRTRSAKCGRPMRIVAHMIARSVAPSSSSSRRSQGSTEPALVM